MRETIPPSSENSITCDNVATSVPSDYYFV
jgi:hypothetical protein